MTLTSIFASLQDVAFSNPFLSIASITIIPTLLWILYSHTLHPLAGIPGPFIASITRLWYVNEVRRGDWDKVARELHTKYGPLVRICPDEVSVSDPEAIKVIYGIKSGFTKTDFYLVWRPRTFETQHPDNFSNLDEQHHSQRRKLVNNVYSMSSILDGEKHIDTCTSMLLKRLSDFEASQTVLDLGNWLQMYAFDVVGELFFGRMFGFMETTSDIGTYIATLDEILPLMCTAAVLPSLMRIPYLLSGTSFSRVAIGLTNIDRAAKQQVRGRREDMAKDAKPASRRDLLDKLFAVHNEKGASADFKIGDIEQEIGSALFAGSDTTAIAMRSIMYNVIRSPGVYEKLVQEIDGAIEDGRITLPVAYAQAIKLPYLTACVKEGFRVHPSVGLSLPRHVPKGGSEIAGRYFAEGCKVGVNAAVVHFDTSVFGADAAEFNPERWFRPDATHMEKYLFHFGGGSRTCIGKNISLAEIYKSLPAMFHQFRFELAYPERPLTSKNWWFNKQEGFHVRLQRRAS